MFYGFVISYFFVSHFKVMTLWSNLDQSWLVYIMFYSWFNFNLDRRTTHPEFDSTSFWTHDLWIMHEQHISNPWNALPNLWDIRDFSRHSQFTIHWFQNPACLFMTINKDCCQFYMLLNSPDGHKELLGSRSVKRNREDCLVYCDRKQSSIYSHYYFIWLH